ncbi:MAG: bifunctional (p)ppGpp synthetase/guanosine-3',5'-bis(diphosphate) 3'-pyrophosphohydrolase [Nitrospinae bacterium]|nr:bifunctional (p)ppGpp synthetase/guanosine-3',5'-bis(diphosphate) 3'-pyrophosphohydrolase [Nitrospinota bacterium]
MLKLKDITDAVLKYHPSADLDVILEAYLYSAKAHRGQIRRSGAAYFSHPVEVAFNLSRLKMDEKTVAAGLLHDTLEDTLATPEEIKQLFGDEIYQLVDGVTKIGQVEFASKEEKQAENYRKMILAMARDIRVILIKLADRAHNMGTLDSLSAEQRQRIARETLDIYAPLANRLGIGWLKAELENGSFKHLHPDSYRMIEERVAEGEDERKKYVDSLCAVIGEELAAANICGAVAGRPKHFFSIYDKMREQNIAFDDVYDLIGVRILTDSVKNCYALLGLIHSLWKPIPGKFKDYIAMPKPNLYQSLHTTVIGPEGKRVEVQIRTEEMHRVAEEGIAAHWQYKEGGSGQPKHGEGQLLWVRHLLESQKDLTNPREFLSAFKVDLFPHEVYVFTPQGHVIALPKGASPVDFAYEVHTDIGSHCFAAKVNGKIVPLRYRLRNGDRVEIVASKQKTPSRDWLSFVKTSKARSKISAYLNSEEKARSQRLGQDLLERELDKFDLHLHAVMKSPAMEEAVKACGFNSPDSLLRALGLGKLSIHHVIDKLVPKEKIEEKRTGEESRIKLKESEPPKRREGSGIRVKCFNDNILIRVGKCCNPLPGDRIVGYITRGRGVSVHHADCPSMKGFLNETERFVDVEWDTVKKTSHVTRVHIVTEDRPGLLASISGVLADRDINITKANVQQGPYKRAYFDLSIEINDLDHLNRTLAEVKKVKGVIHVERVAEFRKKIPGKTRQEKPEGDSNVREEDSGTLINYSQ